MSTESFPHKVQAMAFFDAKSELEYPSDGRFKVTDASQSAIFVEGVKESSRSAGCGVRKIPARAPLPS